MEKQKGGYVQFQCLKVKLLEKKALAYDVPLTERPPETMEATIDPEIMEDRFVFGHSLNISAGIFMENKPSFALS